MSGVAWQGAWIWTAADLPARNRFVRFRRAFDWSGDPVRLHLTADTRYQVHVNGELLGFGPVRAWPAHYRYDTYDLTPLLRPGANVVAVEVQHYGESTFQSLDGPPGLLAQLESASATIVTDASWRCSPNPAFVAAVPRISCQLGFEEQYDARLADHWTAPDYDDSAWPTAVALRPADDGFHRDLGPRAIPFLTAEPVLPQRVIEAVVVRSQPYRFTVYAKPYLFPTDHAANMLLAHAYLATQVWSPSEAPFRASQPHKWGQAFRVNGEDAPHGQAVLRAGWNSLVLSLRRSYHLAEFAIVVDDGPEELRFCAGGAAGGPRWVIAGPFGLGERDLAAAANDKDTSLVVAQPVVPEATCAAGEALWASGDVAALLREPYAQPVRAEHDLAVDVFLQAYTDEAVPDPPQIEGLDGLVSGADWTTVHPSPDGDVRLVLDYGREIVGFQRFEIEAPAGTVVDHHNFEFIQPDGRRNYAEGMNNSFRYTCTAGRQSYQTMVRRGFQYCELILRHQTAPVRLRGVGAIFSSYPQRRVGRFASADAQLDRIWEVGAHSLRCCAEDTYTDCPTYEQTHWVGDARNEALVDWAVNGDPRLWRRCLEQVGQSLERSPITESEVPSGWRNLLPAWSFLWMRSCREYLLHSGDAAGARPLLDWIARNVQGIRLHLNGAGLFEIQAWNMFDWAPMDTPTKGVVTHQNCLAVHGLRDAAELADWLNEPTLAGEWRALATELAAAVNAHLWVEERGAYTDCLRDGRPSEVFSQQTQTAACMSGVAAGERGERCRHAMHHPPDGFVKAGSPFFEFFLLEAYQQEGRDQEFIDTIRRDWGFMVDMGATTFWEMWSGRGGRLTRSHCHGWSAAPTFFLSTWVLGIRPGGPGFSPCLVEPHPCSLPWCRGVVPTPAGPVEAQWENAPGQPFVLRVTAPPDVTIEVRLPRAGTATVNGRTVDAPVPGATS